MKLSNYLNSHKDNNKLTESEKFLVYQKILDKQYKTQKKISFKMISYSVLTAFIMFAIFGVYFIDTKSEITNGVYVENSPMIVNADYVAQVIQFEGDFFVSNNGEEIKTSSFKNNDLVYLSSGTELIFNIDSEIQAKIIGEASFTINKHDAGYKMDLLYGDFIKIKSLEDQKEPVKLVLEDTLSINIDGNDTDFEITKEDDEYKIDNKSNKKLIVSTINPNTGTETESEISSNQTLAINTKDLSEIDSQEELKNALETGELEQVFVVNDKEENENINTPILAAATLDDKEQNNNVKISLLSSKPITGDIEIITGDTTTSTGQVVTGNSVNNNIGIIDFSTGDIDLDISKQIEENLGIGNSKTVITAAQSELLSKNINNTFITKDLEKLELAYLELDKNNFNASFNKLKNRIKNVYNGLGINFEEINTIDNQTRILQFNDRVVFLSNELNDNYHIPGEYITVLNNLSKSLMEMYNYELPIE